MFTVKTEDLKMTDREVKCPKGNFTSHRILLEKDGMGFTLTETHIPKDTHAFWHYKNHLEACYCVSGGGWLYHPATGDEFKIEPGVTYALNGHEAHTFNALEDTVLICVFNPPLKGKEVHKEDGSYV